MVLKISVLNVSNILYYYFLVKPFDPLSLFTIFILIIDQLSFLLNIKYNFQNNYLQVLILHIILSVSIIFAGENLHTIIQFKDSVFINTLLILEKLASSCQPLYIQIGFYAKWLLDNICKHNV